MSHLGEIQVYERWVMAWNEDVSVLHDITAVDCTVHQARTDGKLSDELQGVDALKRILTEASVFFENVRMVVEVGPIVERQYVSTRWKFSGSYKGGMPGATAKAGKRISFYGMDMMLVKEGKIKEYWVSSDGIHLMEQLGVF